MDRATPDLGRHLVTKREEHKGAFKTPTLRDVARRPPYMHDGSVLSPTEVVGFYNRGGTPNPWLSGEAACNYTLMAIVLNTAGLPLPGNVDPPLKMRSGPF